MDDQQLESAFNAFQKIRPMLRCVPHYHDSEYGILPRVSAGCVEDIMAYKKPVEFRTNPEDEKYPYRHAFPGPIILWEPKLEKYPHPTFKQFLEAFYQAI